jgi:hypothetical protein
MVKILYYFIVIKAIQCKLKSKHLLKGNGRPFRVIWNSPSDRCRADGVNLELEKYNID